LIFVRAFHHFSPLFGFATMQGIHSLLALLADSSSLAERRGEAMEDRRGNRATLVFSMG
jgi:hypothetical protein